MKKENKLLKNIEQMLKQLNCRSYLHHFGPKKYKLKYHLFALLLMQAYKLSLKGLAGKQAKILGCPYPDDLL